MATRREHPLERLHRDFDTLFGQLWGGWLTPTEQEFETMRVWDFSIKENEQELVVRAEVPGFEENELDVQINQDVLTIKAEKQQKDEQHTEYRNFFRAITLPPGIDAERARAMYRNGVLELHIPRAEASKPRRIAVQGEQAGGAHPLSAATEASARQGQQSQGVSGAGQAAPASQAGKAGQRTSNAGEASEKAKK